MSQADQELSKILLAVKRFMIQYDFQKEQIKALDSQIVERDASIKSQTEELHQMQEVIKSKDKQYELQADELGRLTTANKDFEK